MNRGGTVIGGYGGGLTWNINHELFQTGWSVLGHTRVRS